MSQVYFAVALELDHEVEPSGDGSQLGDLAPYDAGAAIARQGEQFPRPHLEKPLQRPVGVQAQGYDGERTAKVRMLAAACGRGPKRRTRGATSTGAGRGRSSGPCRCRRDAALEELYELYERLVRRAGSRQRPLEQDPGIRASLDGEGEPREDRRVVLLRQRDAQRPSRREIACGPALSGPRPCLQTQHLSPAFSPAFNPTLGPARSPDLGQQARSHDDLCRDNSLQLEGRVSRSASPVPRLASSVSPLGKHAQYG